jgi:hypothetical protein
MWRTPDFPFEDKGVTTISIQCDPSRTARGTPTRRFAWLLRREAVGISVLSGGFKLNRPDDTAKPDSLS